MAQCWWDRAIVEVKSPHSGHVAHAVNLKPLADLTGNRLALCVWVGQAPPPAIRMDLAAAAAARTGSRPIPLGQLTECGGAAGRCCGGHQFAADNGLGMLPSQAAT